MLKCISPVDGSAYVERPYADSQNIDSALTSAASAAHDLRAATLPQRADLCSKWVDAFIAKSDLIAEELAWQMGRPIQYGPGEVRGFEERARSMIALAAEALKDVTLPKREGFTRFIRRDPLGVVLTVAPWNYPQIGRAHV